MATNTKPATTIDNAPVAIDAPVPLAGPAPSPSPGRNVALLAAGEVNGYLDAFRKASELGCDLGFIGLQMLAARLGATANKLGRPTEAEYLRFTSALAGRRLSYEQRADLARIANKSHGEAMREAEVEKYKPVAPVSGKAAAHAGSQSYKINLPALLAESLGAE